MNHQKKIIISTIIKSMEALHANSLSVKIGDTPILSDVSFRLYPNELCGLIGPSGAGKSTLIRLILGIQKPTQGKVELGKMEESLGSVGYVPQDDALHRSLTVSQSLDFAARLRLHHLTKEAREHRVQEVIEQIGLSERLNVRIRALSGGQRKRVSVALELLNQPQLLILDEPTSGLDPGLESKMMGLFQEVAQNGRIIMVATHAMQSLLMCNKLLVLIKGRLAYGGTPQGALKWFGVSTFAGIFEQLPSHAPAVWAAKWVQEGKQFIASSSTKATDSPTMKQSSEKATNNKQLSLSERLEALKSQRKK